MSFEKIRLCASVQVAFDIFNMFRHGGINMYTDYADDESNLKRFDPKQQYGDAVVPRSEVALDAVLTSVANYVRGRYDLIMVHNIVKQNSPGWIEESRKVVFVVKEPSQTTTVSILVCRSYCDGDEVSGWTDWRMYSAGFKVTNTLIPQKNKPTESFIFHVYRNDSAIRNQLSEQMRINIGDLVCLSSHYSE